MLDLAIRGGTIIDGTGSPGRQGDVGVRDGRIVAVGAAGHLDEVAAETFEADGLVVAPGFIDPHTHYDAQLFWDPLASPSNVHGVTSVVAGNCGFTLAPLHAKDADYLRRMMAKVEGMPLAALEHGVDWQWETFADYLGRLDGRIGLNAGFMVGHCALRRYVMGADAVGNEATPAQVEAMVGLLHESIDAGGLGLSTTLSSSHSDGDGQPVASRHASRDELLALCEAVGEREGTFLERAFEAQSHSEAAGVFRRLAGWDRYVIGDTYSAANEGLTGRVVGDIAAERGQEAFDTLVDIVAHDDFRTVLWPMPTDNDDESWRMRQRAWDDPRVMRGGSDAGAHLDRMCGSTYTTPLLADCLRGRGLATVEGAVEMLPQAPAQLFGWTGRGTIAEGNHADLVVFDPETVGAESARLVEDLPGGSARLTAGSEGMVRVYVAGVGTVEQEKAPGAPPGGVLRWGRHTATVPTR